MGQLCGFCPLPRTSCTPASFGQSLIAAQSAFLLLARGGSFGNLREVLVAQRGGLLGRKHDGEPGVRTLWQGLREVAVFVEGLRYAAIMRPTDLCAMRCNQRRSQANDFRHS
jgi:hypothetical protein